MRGMRGNLLFLNKYMFWHHPSMRNIESLNRLKYFSKRCCSDQTSHHWGEWWMLVAELKAKWYLDYHCDGMPGPWLVAGVVAWHGCVRVWTWVRVECKTRPIINNTEGGRRRGLSHILEGKCRHHPQPWTIPLVWCPGGVRGGRGWWGEGGAWCPPDLFPFYLSLTGSETDEEMMPL